MKSNFFQSAKLPLSFLALAVCGLAQPLPSRLATTILSDSYGPYTAQQYKSIKFADVTGDGFPDLCYLDATGIHCAVFQPATGTFGPAGLWTTAFTLTSAASDSIWETIQYGDMDGDGKADLCGRTSQGVVCYKSDGFQFVSFSSGVPLANAFGNEQLFDTDPSYWRTIRLVDVNHDGKLDVCGRSLRGMTCQLFGADPMHPFIFSGFTTWSAQFSDANGWKVDPSNWSTIQFADVNGDGLPDVCARGTTGAFCLLNTGTLFGPARVSETAFSNANYWNQVQYYSTIHFGDLDGDGKADVCGRGVAGVYCGLTRNNGQGLAFVGTSTLAVNAFADAGGWNAPSRYLDFWLVDVNHDGKADICGRGQTGIECTVSRSTSTGLSFGGVQTIVDNFGDFYNWQLSPSNWATVQPVIKNASRSTRGTSFCGRGNSGIWCSDYN